MVGRVYIGVTLVHHEEKKSWWTFTCLCCAYEAWVDWCVVCVCGMCGVRVSGGEMSISGWCKRNMLSWLRICARLCMGWSFVQCNLTQNWNVECRPSSIYRAASTDDKYKVGVGFNLRLSVQVLPQVPYPRTICPTSSSSPDRHLIALKHLPAIFTSYQGLYHPYHSSYPHLPRFPLSRAWISSSQIQPTSPFQMVLHDC